MPRIILLACALGLLLGGCSAVGRPAGSAVTPVFAFSEAVVGPNRLALGLLRDGSPLNDPGAIVELRFFRLDDPSATPQGATRATYYGQGLPAAIYVARAEFDRPGAWGIEISTRLSGQSEPTISRLRLEVLERSAAPNIGDPAIAVETPTVATVSDPSQLASGSVENLSLYQISLADALVSGKPTVVLFATPAFCRTAVCGPSLQVLQALEQQYGSRANFIHVEVYRYPFADSFRAQSELFTALARENRAPTPEERTIGMSEAMAAWHLPSEPWLFLIDAQGVIVDRYEGGITREELGPAIEQLVGS